MDSVIENCNKLLQFSISYIKKDKDYMKALALYESVLNSKCDLKCEHNNDNIYSMWDIPWMINDLKKRMSEELKSVNGSYDQLCTKWKQEKEQTIIENMKMQSLRARIERLEHL